MSAKRIPLWTGAAFVFVLICQLYAISLWRDYTTPTFLYLADEFPATNSPVCAGDTLIISVGVWSSGKSAPTLLAGSIRRPDESAPFDRSFPPVWTGGQATGQESEVTFPYEITIPDIPPGAYIYNQQATQMHSYSQGYKSIFEVKECNE